MSRIGNQVLAVPTGVEVSITEGNVVTVKGSKGSLINTFNDQLTIVLEDSIIKVSRTSEEKFIKSIHGTTTALIKNMIEGVTNGYSKTLLLNGVGYRAAIAGKKITLQVGFSHPVEFVTPEGITVECPTNTEIIISGSDKQVVGEFAANIRKIRPPEPYKGKGIKYKEEIIRRKEGKRAGK